MELTVQVAFRKQLSWYMNSTNQTMLVAFLKVGFCPTETEEVNEAARDVVPTEDIGLHRQQITLKI